MGKTGIRGTIYTREIKNNLPYYVIENEDGEITYIARNTSREFIEEEIFELLKYVKLEEAKKKDGFCLKMNFSVDENLDVMISHVEQLERHEETKIGITDKEFFNAKSFAKCNYLDFNHVLSDKAYCKPVAIIGENPRPLEYSLFREFITNEIWSKGISTFGYRYVQEDLMLKIGNRPYLSVDFIMEGLTPGNLPEQLRYRLLKYYEDELRSKKHPHDRVEYDIIFNSFDFETDEKLDRLPKDEFGDYEIAMLRKTLFNMTLNAIKNYAEISKKDKAMLSELNALCAKINIQLSVNDNNVMKLYKFISELSEAIKQNGFICFVRHARCIYMALRLLETLGKKGYVSDENIKEFANSVGEIRFDYTGAYDIRSDCYSRLRDEYTKRFVNEKTEYGEVKHLDRKGLETAIHDAGFDITADLLEEFIVDTIRNGAEIKLECMNSIGMLLELVKQLADAIGIAREDMSYLDIHDLFSYHSRESYIQTIGPRRTLYHAYSKLILPDAIFGVGDIDVITGQLKI